MALGRSFANAMQGPRQYLGALAGHQKIRIGIEINPACSQKVGRFNLDLLMLIPIR